MEPSKSPRHRHHGPSKEEEEKGGEGGPSSGTGQSRASKKRAKKKHKQDSSQLQQDVPRGRDEDEARAPPSAPESRGGGRGDDADEKLEKKKKQRRISSQKGMKSSRASDLASGQQQPSDGGGTSGFKRRREAVTESRRQNSHPKVEEEDIDDDDEDEVCDSDSEFFDAGAGRKVQFNQARDVGSHHEEAESEDEAERDVAPPTKGEASRGSSATLPPPCVTNITLLLARSSSDLGRNVSDEEGASSATANDTRNATPSNLVSRLTTEQRANAMLNFLLQPSSVTTDEFYASYWEKKPLLVQAAEKASSADIERHRTRFSGLMGLSTIQDATQPQSQRQHPMYYSRDLNVTKYEKVNGSYKRRTLDPAHPNAPSRDDSIAQDPGRQFVRVDHDQLWDKFYHQLGCTIRLLCPHKHFPNVHAVLSLLEHEFGNMVGANAYLTPPNASQGFAPHYDDIEAFCCQLEGRKRWKVYAPIAKSERLPRVSSRDYAPSDLRDAEPVLDVVLSPGDVLYMPRGWIHQACTLPASTQTPRDGHGHSLHLTISTMQQWAWVDLMENLMSDAVESLASSDRTTLLREGLPRNFVSYMGVMHDHSDESMPESLKKRPYEAQEEDTDELARLAQIQESRDTFRREAKRRISRVAQEAMNLLDASCDQMAKRFLSYRLPPTGLARDVEVRLQPDTLCRLLRPGIARLVLEEGKAVLYHCADNSLVFHENPLSPLEFEMDDAPALEQILTTVEPRWIGVQDLYHDTVEDKVAVAQALYDEGILAVRS